MIEKMNNALIKSLRESKQLHQSKNHGSDYDK